MRDFSFQSKSLIGMTAESVLAHHLLSVQQSRFLKRDGRPSVGQTVAPAASRTGYQLPGASKAMVQNAVLHGQLSSCRGASPRSSVQQYCICCQRYRYSSQGETHHRNCSGDRQYHDVTTHFTKLHESYLSILYYKKSLMTRKTCLPGMLKQEKHSISI